MKIVLHDFEAGSENPYDGLQVDDSPTLLKILDDLQYRDPFILELEGDNGYRMTIGIGGPICCVQYGANNGDPPYLTAVLKDEVQTYGRGVQVYLCGGQKTQFDISKCLPFTTLKTISCHFLETGNRSSAVDWIELEPA
ncbi:hypothetical protein [Occallatibacter savannae]|uniref:hypothetical protein n=1 Tax=Occallatibacter savannae TaxID=1002691 RepID=UPI000D69FB78|nr:hypothetical protein [Occallatibacter savannae]